MPPRGARINGRSARLAGYALALVAPAMAFGMRFLPGLELGPPYLLFGPPILLAALLGGPWAGIVSTAVATALSTDWVRSTAGAPGVSRPETVALVAFVANGLLVSLLAHLHRRARDRAAAVERAVALRDTTSRLEDSEQRLRRTRRDAEMTSAQLGAVIWSVQDGICLSDRDGRHVLVNPAFARLHGLTLDGDQAFDHAAATAGLELLELDGRPLDHSAWPTSRVLRGESFQGWELQARHEATGREAFLSFSGVPIRDGAGAVELGLVVTRDVTAARRSREALERSEQRFRALIEKSTDVILLLDADGRIAFLSPSATESMGWDEDETLGRPLLASVHPEDRARADKLLEQLRARPGAREQALLRHAHADGSWRHLALDARNLLGDPAVRGLVVNARDISAQVALEQQLRQAQRLESLGRLAGGVAHDFNNLLTVVLAGVGDLKRAPADARAVAEIAAEIEIAGGLARDLTRQLLAFARKQAGAPVVVDLGAVVREGDKLLRRLLGEGVALATDLAAGLWPVRCDRGQLEQILVNLAANARDAMPAGGRLTLATANVEVPDDGRAAQAGERPGRWVRLSVIDEGEGMSPAIQEQIFEPFFTTKEKGKGTGLGLSTVYGIVTQTGGFIRVDSTPGQGTRFDVFLPRALAEATAVIPPAEGAPGGGHEAILLVEDNPQVRAAAGRILRGAGYQVLEAAGGEEALQAVPGHLNLLVTDVVMPGLGGRVVAERLRGARPGLRVLFVSGYALEGLQRSDALPGGVAFLAKPFEPAALLAAVRGALDAPADLGLLEADPAP